MKRSEINQQIEQAITFFKKMNFHLPPWAFWSPEEWRQSGANVDEIVTHGLGWDITDFGSGNFEQIGLINFNLRNGLVDASTKPYCEKILIVKEDQVTPLHTHRSKREDIINRGGGNLVLELVGSDASENVTEDPVTVRIDAIPRTVDAGGKVILTPGESIFLEPGVFHKFYGEAGHGLVLVGEVSSVNDDNTDNVFYDDSPRFPDIEEDEPARYLLVNDYGSVL